MAEIEATDYGYVENICGTLNDDGTTFKAIKALFFNKAENKTFLRVEEDSHKKCYKLDGKELTWQEDKNLYSAEGDIFELQNKAESGESLKVDFVTCEAAEAV